MESNKGILEVLPLGRGGPMHHYRLEPSPEKALGVLVDTKLTINQRYAHVAKVATSLLGCIRLGIASRSREVIHPLCSALARHVWVLCPELGSPVQERRGHAGASSVKGHKDG
ncbi:mitochondrial enolase superfamily member 1 [Grus japonensis]|uniref:Mitochondrial enolase superfamily member 1 n=1 Tax=Grus japonensis TaxID=30415 RepID=A0ABC9W929_GRUJA